MALAPLAVVLGVLLLVWQIAASLRRVLLGFTLSAVAGVALGLLVGTSPVAMRGLDPIFQVLRTVPPLAWLPISLAAFRDAQPSAIFVIFITAIWPVIINTAVGVRNVPQDYRNVARVIRLRIPAGLLSVAQLDGVAAIAEELGGGYADITTRANLQIREIPARRGTLFVPMHWIAALCDAGRANPMVGDATDPLSGQPELKHTPAAIAAWTPGWQGFLLSRDIRPDLAQWCAAIPEAGSGCGSCRRELRALLATIGVLEPS